MTILLTLTTSFSPIEEQRTLESIDSILRNQYFRFYQSIPPLWFRFTSLFSSSFICWSFFFVLYKTLETLRSQAMAMKRNGKSLASSDSDEKVIFFKDVSLGPHETQLRFRLIHFWEARNPVKKTLIGLEMLLIDEQVRQFSKNCL